MAKPSRVVQMPLELVSQKNLEKPTRWSLDCCKQSSVGGPDSSSEEQDAHRTGYSKDCPGM